MVIILNGADFSANNLGTVEVTAVLNAFTISALEASGNTSLVGQKKAAINTFFKKIGAFNNSGVFSKLRYLYIPMLASDVAHSMVNYKDSGFSALSVPSDKFQLRSGGIATNVTGSIACPSSMKIPFKFEKNNFSVLAMCGENITVGGPYLFSYNGDSNSCRFYLMLSKSTGSDGSLLAYNFITPSSGNTLSLGTYSDKRARLFSISDNGAVNYMTSAGNSATISIQNWENIGIDTADKDTPLFSNASGVLNTSNMSSIKMLAIGGALTSEEMATFKSAADSLDAILSN